MKVHDEASSHGRKAAQFRRTVRAILVVLERLAAHAGVESNELDALVDEFFNRDVEMVPHFNPDREE